MKAENILLVSLVVQFYATLFQSQILSESQDFRLSLNSWRMLFYRVFIF
jgi:hypothetical protein